MPEHAGLPPHVLSACCLLAIMCLAGGVLAQGNGLIFHATFDGSLAAQTPDGPSEPGEISNPPEYLPGKLGQALLCGEDGTNLEYPADMLFRSEAGSVAFWVQPMNWRVDDGRFHVFVEAGVEESQWFVLYKYFQDPLLLLLQDPTARRWTLMEPVEDIVPGKWVHIAATWRPGMQRLYVNGRTIKQASEPRPPRGSFPKLMLGDRPWHTPGHTKTLIDDFRIYSRELSEQEVGSFARGPAMSLRRLPRRSELELRVDTTSYLFPTEGLACRAALTPVAGGEPLQTVLIDAFPDGVGRAIISTADLAPGDYRLTIETRDGAGGTMGQTEYPVSVLGEETQILENSAMAMTFDSHTGSLLQIRNKATGLEYLLDTAYVSPIHELTLYPQWAGRFIDDRRVRVAGAKDWPAPAIERTAGDAGEKLVFRYEDERLPTVEWSVELPDESQLATWRISVTVPQRSEPGDDYRVTHVRFPVLSNLQPSADPAETTLAWPYAQGELLVNPRNNPPRERKLTYMGWASMAWADLYAPGGGLYYACHDPTHEQADIEFHSDGPEGTTGLSWTKLRTIYPGETWQSGRFITGVHEGNWRWGADRYREYYDANYRLAPRPEWLEAADGWLGTGGPNYEYADLPGMYEDAQWLGLNYLQCWAQMVLGEMYYCFYMPDPARGGEAGLTRAVKGVRDAGGHIGFYVNVWTWDASIPDRIRQYTDSLPPGASLPDWRREFHRYASVFPDGSRKTGTFGQTGYAGMCPEAEGYRDYLKYWIVDRYIQTYGCDSWYLDSCPVTMFGATNYCHSDEHADRPHGISRGFMKLTEDLRAGALPTQVALGSESISDVMLQNTHWALGADYWELTPNFCPEIFDYTFPGVPLFAGSCNRTSGAAMYLRGLPEGKLRPRDVMSASHLLGRRYDALYHPLNRESDQAQHLRRLIALRGKFRQWLYTAQAFGTDGLGELPDGISARCFRHADGKGVTITVVDLRAERGPFTIALSPAVLKVPDVLTGTIYTWSAEAPAQVSAAGNDLSVTLPGFPDDAGAMVLREAR